MLVLIWVQTVWKCYRQCYRQTTKVDINMERVKLSIFVGIRQYYRTVPYHPMSHVVFEEKKKALTNILSSVSFQQCLIFSNLQTRYVDARECDLDLFLAIHSNCYLLSHLIYICTVAAYRIDPDQTAPFGAVRVQSIMLL